MWKWASIILAGLITFCSSQTEKARFVSFRLHNGNTSGNSGILQVHNPLPGSEWMNICPTYSISLYETDEILRVVCRSLGYDSDPSDIISSITAFEESDGSSLSYSGLSCSGDEADLSECRYYSVNQNSYCYEGYNITCPTCEEDGVRLANGLIPSQGYVEICIDGVWTRTCTSTWNYANSFVVCRQLGLPATQARYTIEASQYIRQSSGFATMDVGFACYGNEESLTDCYQLQENYYCEQRFEFGFIDYILLQCLGEDPIVGCMDGDIRLVGGEDQYEGVVQVCRDGMWGTFTRTSWDSLEAVVVCRQLNLLAGNFSRVTIPYIYESSATGPIFDAPSCTGTEANIGECANTTNIGGLYSGRNHNNDATVRCHSTPNQVTHCADGDVRLAGSSADYEGRVELCYEGVWGSVCGSYRGYQNAAVVCHQLGYLGENIEVVYSYQGYKPFGEGTVPIHIKGLICKGYETDLLECEREDDRIGYHTCSTHQDFAIRCDPRPVKKCEDGDLRLAAGYSQSEGVPQVCFNGQWSSACYQTWTYQHSQGFCRLLLNRTDVSSTYSSCCARVYDLTTSNSSLRDITCTSEYPKTFLRDCSFILVPSTCTSVIVGCYVLDNCTNGSVRLVEGETSTSRIVQVCQDGVWGNIVAWYSWSSSAATVVCRQLGLPWEWAIGDIDYFGLTYNSREGPFFYTDIRCNGNEESLLNCSASPPLSLLSEYRSPLSYSYSSPARVVCQNNRSSGHPPCRSGEVRLGNMTDNGQRMEGRVEACIEGTWVVFCDLYSWTNNEARTVCRQLLGYEASVSYGLFEKDFGSTNLSLVRSLVCGKNSTRISQCSLNSEGRFYFVGTCSHDHLVAVVCERETVYEVTVAPLLPPPYDIGQSVDLSCVLSPPLQSPETVFYSWTIGNNDAFGTRTVNYAQNVTVPITFQMYKSGFFICNVNINGYIVSGYMEVSINGQLIPKPSTRVGQMRKFEVMTPTSIPLQSLLYNLNWFYNGEMLFNTTHSLITNGNSSLLIAPSEGVLKVQYNGLLALPHDETCESTILKFLQGYAGFSPTTFTLESPMPEEELPQIRIKSNKESKVMTFTDGDMLVVSFNSQVPDCLDSNDVRIRLFYNGLESYIFNGYTISQGKIYGSFVVNNATSNDHGIYEIQLRWNFETKCPNYFNYFRQQLFQNYPYIIVEPYFQDIISTIGTSSYPHQEIILSRSYIEAVYYRSFDFTFSANTSVLSSGDIAQLFCSAPIDYPKLSSLSIVKDSVTLLEHSQSNITINTNALKNPYGEYQCVLNASGTVFKRKFKVKEQVNAGVNFELPDQIKCKEKSDILATLKNAVVLYLRRECSCNFTKEDMYDLVLACKDSSQAQINMTLKFSSDDGVISASTLSQMLAGQIPRSHLNTVIGGNTANILTSCEAQSNTAVNNTFPTIAPTTKTTESTTTTPTTKTTEGTTTTPTTKTTESTTTTPTTKTTESTTITPTTKTTESTSEGSKTEQKQTTQFGIVDKLEQQNGLKTQYMIATIIVVFIIGVLLGAVTTSLIIFVILKYRQRKAVNGITRFENEPDDLSFSELNKGQADQDESAFGEVKY